MNYIITYPFSAFLYISIVILITILSFMASRAKGKKIQLFFIILNIAILSCFSGFRGLRVGTDTFQYFTHIERWRNNFKSGFDMEPGLYWLSKLSLYIVDDPQFVFFTVALIINTLIVVRTWTWKDNISFPAAMFLYTATFYIITFSGIRQWLAISIIYFFSKKLFESKYLTFTFCVILASLFHNSALLALTFPIIDIILGKIKTNKQKIYFVMLFFISPFIIIFFIFGNSRFNILNQYSSYISNINWNNGIGITLIIKIILAIAIFLFISKKDFISPDFYLKVRYIYFLGLIVIIPGYYVSNLARIGFYFTIFEIIIFSMIIKNINKRKSFLFSLFIILFTLILFILEMAGSGRGHMPYYPFWRG